MHCDNLLPQCLLKYNFYNYVVKIADNVCDKDAYVLIWQEMLNDAWITEAQN